MINRTIELELIKKFNGTKLEKITILQLCVRTMFAQFLNINLIIVKWLI